MDDVRSAARSPRQTAIAYAECLRRGDFEGLVALHHPDMICALLGDTLVSGRYRGREAFFAHTFKHVLQALAETDEVYLKDFRIGCADDRYAVMLLRGGLPTKAGGRYDQNYLQVFGVQDGLIVETHELLDTMMLEMEVLGRKPAIIRSYPQNALRPALRGAGGAPPPDPARMVQVAQSWTEALAAARWSVLADALDDQVVLQVAGAAPESGTFYGRDAVQTHVRGFAKQFLIDSLRLDGPPRLVCASADGFCILGDVVGRLADGGSYRQTFGFVGSPRGDAVGEVQLYFDTAAQDAQLHGNRLGGIARNGSSEPFTIYSSWDLT